MTALSGWENFYVIAGSSAGALVGLQFVVLTLVAERIHGGVQAVALETYTTPTIVHFGAVLLLSGMMVAPLPGTMPLAILWCVLGSVGVLYSLSLAHCLHSQTAYTPQAADWSYYFVLPFIGYAAIGVSGCLLLQSVREAAFGVAGAALLLLLTGIHNAWDIVTYHVLLGEPDKSAKAAEEKKN